MGVSSLLYRLVLSARRCGAAFSGRRSGTLPNSSLPRAPYLQVHAVGCEVGQRPGGLEVDAHVHQQLADGGEVLDGRVELLSAVGVVAGDAVGGLADAQALGGDADAGAVHQAHDVGDQPALPLADELGRGVVEEDLAGRAAVDAQLVLQAADLDLRPALDKEQAQTPPVGDVRLGPASTSSTSPQPLVMNRLTPRTNQLPSSSW